MSTKVTRENVKEFIMSAPLGREFTAKKLTDKARTQLIMYWNNHVNHGEKEQEIVADRKAGVKFKYLEGDYYWLNKYASKRNYAEGYLADNGFLKKVKY